MSVLSKFVRVKKQLCIGLLPGYNPPTELRLVMIRLIFKIRGQTVEKSFSQSTVTIGLESPDVEGLPIDTSELDREHLRFVDQNGEIYAVNQANDPFITLNGRPFGRKKLSGGDRLEIGEWNSLYWKSCGSVREAYQRSWTKKSSTTMATFRSDR